MLITLIPANLTSKGQRYAAVLDGRTLCTSRQPFYEAARVLLGEGTDPETVLEATHHFVAMRSTVGEAARWTVSDGERYLRKVPWQEHPSFGSETGPGICMGVPENPLAAE
jgi:hypothetical protein